MRLKRETPPLPNAIALPTDFANWEAMLREASRNYSGAIWQIGDLVNYGEKHYGEIYQKAMDATGLSYKRIANVRTVARKFESSRRRENLSFGHHVEVAALPTEEQDRLLDKAEKEGLTRSQLREIVKAADDTSSMAITEEKIGKPETLGQPVILDRSSEAPKAIEAPKSDPQPRIRAEPASAPIETKVAASPAKLTDIEREVERLKDAWLPARPEARQQFLTWARLRPIEIADSASSEKTLH